MLPAETEDGEDGNPDGGAGDPGPCRLLCTSVGASDREGGGGVCSAAAVYSPDKRFPGSVGASESSHLGSRSSMQMPGVSTQTFAAAADHRPQSPDYGGIMEYPQLE